jgi:hypothetical protein
VDELLLHVGSQPLQPVFANEVHIVLFTRPASDQNQLAYQPRVGGSHDPAPARHPRMPDEHDRSACLRLHGRPEFVDLPRHGHGRLHRFQDASGSTEPACKRPHLSRGARSAMYGNDGEGIGAMLPDQRRRLAFNHGWNPSEGAATMRRVRVGDAAVGRRSTATCLATGTPPSAGWPRRGGRCPRRGWRRLSRAVGAAARDAAAR